MKVKIAENAGFCFGVKRATDRLEEAIAKGDGERLFTLGNLIHNDTYNEWLYSRGVRVASIADVESLAASATEEAPVRVFVRAHGIPKEDEARLSSAAQANPHFQYEDCTCPFVKKIHRIADENQGD